MGSSQSTELEDTTTTDAVRSATANVIKNISTKPVDTKPEKIATDAIKSTDKEDAMYKKQEALTLRTLWMRRIH